MFTLGFTFSLSQANAEEYPNKYGSPEKAHKLYVKAKSMSSHSSEQFKAYDEAVKAGSYDAMLNSAYIFMHFTGGAENFKRGLMAIEPALKLNHTDFNRFALIGYAWTGDQVKAKEVLDRELAKGDNIKARFVWDYARYTGNGFYNAPYEPKKVCDENESKFNAKNANALEAYLVGRCYFDGVARTKDELKGINIFEQYKDKAWEASDTLGILYTVGTKHTPQDFNKAADLLEIRKAVSSFRRLPEASYYAAIIEMEQGLNRDDPFKQFEYAAGYGNYQAQWIVNTYKTKGNESTNPKDLIRMNPPADPKLPKGSPRLPDFQFVKGATALASNSSSALTPEMKKQIANSPRMQQLGAYLRANKVLPHDYTNLQGCKEAQTAYKYGKFPDETDNIYEESAAAYAVCLAQSKPFRALQKNPTQMGYKVLDDLMKRNYRKGFDLKQLYDREFR